MIGNLKIENEPIGSVPRKMELVNSINQYNSGKIDLDTLNTELNGAVKETIDDFIKAGQTCICDGEQSKISFIGYPIFGSKQFDFDKEGVIIQFEDGHQRSIPSLNGKELPFRYVRYAGDFVKEAVQHCKGLPYKQAVISPSALSLVYPPAGIDGYSREQFVNDLLDECERDIRSCFNAGATFVQIDATELRLSLKLDPSGSLFDMMIELNKSLLKRFNGDELKNIGIHECRGGDQGQAHSGEIDICEKLIPGLLTLPAGRFFIEYAHEPNKSDILQSIASNINPHTQKVFLSVTKIDPLIESVEEIVGMGIEIARHLPPGSFGLCDNCGFSPFYDGPAVSREIAFQKMLNRSNAAQKLEDILNQSN